MHAIARHSPALWATAVVAIGLHVGIVAALPKAGRPHVALPAAPMAVAAIDLAPRVPAAQFQAFAPAAPAQHAPAAKVEREPKKLQAVVTPVSGAALAKRAEPTTIDMRPHDDDEPVRIATPLPVTVVVPPSP